MTLPIASMQDGTHPRPQALRVAWCDLSGMWGFAFDDSNAGLREHWERNRELPLNIRVPFPFESELSGIGETGYHPVVWYSRDLTTDDLAAADFRGDAKQRLMIRFGAVDYRCRVWLNGHLLGEHEGGHTPFSFDATDALETGQSTQHLVLRAEDDPLDVAQPRGKQEWRPDPHAIWYHRTSGIWQPVWLEAVDQLHIRTLHWTPDVPRGEVRLELELSRRPCAARQHADAAAVANVRLSVDGEFLAGTSVSILDQRAVVVLPIPAQRNGQAHEELLWSPGSPRLIDAEIRLTSDGVVRDEVASYFGMRSARVSSDAFLLNDRPLYLRSVLYQGYWTPSHLAAPSPAALREDTELILALGFNSVRVHQKVEDPRFLFWADRLGLLVWGEAPGAYEFSERAVQRTTAEWLAAVERDRSHPSIVTWVPLNESWGVQHIAASEPQRQFARAITALTRAIDPTRPVISNDGWEHADSDLITVHDYEADSAVVGERYRDAAARERLLAGDGPAGRPVVLPGQATAGRPTLLTEFGGISFATTYTADDAWGYSAATSTVDFVSRIAGLVNAVRGSSFLAGFCYTQFSDTLQETNGLVSDDRAPKAPLEQLRAAIVSGSLRGEP